MLKRHEAQLVDDQQLLVRHLLLQAHEAAFVPGLHQLVQEGGAGADRLVGGAGSDRFVFANGTKSDFSSADLIDLSTNSFLNSFSDVQSAATQAGGDILIDLGGGSTLMLQTFLVTELSGEDFQF